MKETKKIKENLIPLGKRIRAVRKSLGLKQKEMAVRLDLAGSYISEIESARARPGPEFFVRFARAFNVNMNYLFMGTGDMMVKPGKRVNLKEYNFDREVDSVETLLWLMEHSSFFKNTMLSLASKTILENGPLIKKSLQLNLPSKEEEKD